MGTIAEDITTFQTDVGLVHGIVHGPAIGAGSTVLTEGGNVSSVQKFYADVLAGGVAALLAGPSVAPGSLILKGKLGSGVGAGRTDVPLELQANSTDDPASTPLLSVYQTADALEYGEGTPGESGIVFMLKGMSGAALHSGSISAIFADKTLGASIPVMRIAETWDDATYEETDIAIYGGSGVNLFGATYGSPSAAPGYHTMRVNGNVVIAPDAAHPPAPTGPVLDIGYTQNADTTVQIANNSTGAASQTLLRLSNGTYDGDIFMFGTNYTNSGQSRSNGMLIQTTGPAGLTLNPTSGPLYLSAGSANVARIRDTDGLFLLGISTDGIATGAHHFCNDLTPDAGNIIAAFGKDATHATFLLGSVSLPNYNGGNTAMYVGTDSVTGSSGHFGGTIGVSGGADHAETEKKCASCATVTKGQIIGWDANGEITDKWALAVGGFAVKSTMPSFVSNYGVFGTEAQLGPKPRKPSDPLPGETPRNYAQRWDDYYLAVEKWDADYEASREPFDRIAYNGKVPVNVTGARPGDYVVAVQDGDGIGGAIVSLAEKQSYDGYIVGRVRKILDDERAEITVIIN